MSDKENEILDDENSAEADSASDPEKKKKGKKQKQRFEWLDQFRGLVILLFIVSVVTWKFSMDIANGEFPVEPVYYDHGWRLYDSLYKGEHHYDPYIITIIDIGQQIFIFLVGFMQAYSYLRRKQKEDLKNARIHMIERFAILMLLSLADCSDFFTEIGEPDSYMWNFLFNGTLANIAWASLFASLIMEVMDDPDKRFIAGFSVLVLHAILYSFPSIKWWSQGWMKVPWNTIGHIGIAFIATAYTGWFFDEDLKPTDRHFRDRVLPISFSMFVINYLVDWLQWAEHHHVTMALAVLAVGTGGFATWLFYILDTQYHIKFPGLSVMGKNMLMLFILSLIISEAYIPAVEDLVIASRVYGLFLAGIIPILIMWGIAKFLDHFNIVIKI